MAATFESVMEYLRLLRFDLSINDTVISATRKVGADTSTQILGVLDTVADAKRNPNRVASNLQTAKGHRRATHRIVVLNASPDDVPQLQKLYEPRRVAVLTYSAFLDSMLDAVSICERTISAGEFQKVNETYLAQNVSDEAGEVLAQDSVELVSRWIKHTSGGLLVVLADAGHGKTSLARKIAYALAKSRLERSDSPVPLFIPFGEYRRVTDWPGLILVRLQTYGVLGIPSDAFDFLMREGRVVLILDGFDEMSEESGIRVAEENLRMIADHIKGRGRVVLTSRSTFFRSSAELAEMIERRIDQSFIRTYELKEFDQTQRRTYVERVSPDKRTADRIISTIQRNPELGEIAGSPLVLNMLARVIGDSAARFAAGRDRADLYAAYFAALFARERERQGHGLSDNEQFAFLERIADSMYSDKTSLYVRNEIAYFVTEALPDRVERLRGRRSEEEALISKLCDHAAFSTEGSAIRFGHPTFRDYFAARVWESRLRRGDLQVLLRPNLSDAVIAFLAELLAKDTEALRTIARSALTRSADGQLVRNGLRLLDAFCLHQYPGDTDLRRQQFGELTGRAVLNFNSRDLSGLQLTAAVLRGATFTRAILDGTHFAYCDLRDASFDGALLRMTFFERAQLTGAKFSDMSQFISIRIKRTDMPLTDIELAKKELSRLGASVPGVSRGPSAEQEVVRLLVDQFRRFKAEGKATWEAERVEPSLVRSLEGKERTFVERELIPALVSSGYYRKRRIGTRTLVQLTKTREPTNLLDNGDLSPELEALVARIAPTARRLMEL